MPNVRRDGNGTHGYGMPVALIVILMGGYWLITEWNALPGLIGSAISFH
jgi:hypothetical protein